MGVNHLSTFDADLRNVSFAVTSSMGFPILLSTLQPFQMCIHNRKHSKGTFSHDSQLMGNKFMANLHTSLESTCKSRISKTATRCQNWGVNHLSTFDADLRNVSFALISIMGFPAILSTFWGVNHLSTFDADLRNVSCAVTSPMGFPILLSTLQPFQMCIHNRKYSKWTFSHDSQLMGNKFMANLHASLESTCKSRISKTATWCQNWGVNHLSTFDADLRNVSFALISIMGFPIILSTLQPFQMCIYHRKYSKRTFSHDSQLMGNKFMANLHASLESTCKSRISKIATRCQNWGGQSSFNFWCWSQKCKFCIDIFHGVSCIIKHITAISNVHSQ